MYRSKTDNLQHDPMYVKEPEPSLQMGNYLYNQNVTIYKDPLEISF